MNQIELNGRLNGRSFFLLQIDKSLVGSFIFLSYTPHPSPSSPPRSQPPLRHRLLSLCLSARLLDLLCGALARLLRLAYSYAVHSPTNLVVADFSFFV